MKPLVQEYGFVMIAIICVSVFLSLFSYTFMRNVKDSDGDGVNDSTLISFSYNTNAVELEGVSLTNSQDLKVAPHFKSKDNNAVNYKINTDSINRGTVTNLIKCYADKVETVDLTNRMTIQVYRYDYIKTYVDSDGNPMENGKVLMEEVTALDKFGNPIKDSSGNYVKTKQPKCKVNYLGTLTGSNSFSVTQDTAKFKIVCRVTNNNVKSEITKFLIKEQ